MRLEDIIVEITKVLAVSADAYILFDYFDNSYERKVGRSGFLAGVLCYMFMMMGTTYLDIPNLNFFVGVAMLLACAIIMYKGNIRAKIMSTVVYILLILACELIVYFSVNLVTPVSMQEQQMSEAYNIPFLIYAKIVQFILFKGIMQFWKNSRYKLLPTDFLALISVSFISLYITLSLLVKDYFDDTIKATINLLVSVGLLIANIIIFNLFVKSSKYAKIEMEQSLILQNIESSEKRYHEVVAIQNQIRGMWHDINNHIAAAKGMIGAGDGAAEKYMDEIEKKVGEYAYNTAFGNSIIDTVLYTKTMQAKEHGIDISMSLEMDKNIPISQIDLCTIFSNALDNAIEACEEVEPGKRFIRVKAVQNQGFLYIRIVNSSAIRSKSGGEFRTTKKDGHRHGIGLKSMQNAVDSYSGTMTAEYKDGVFELNTLLSIQAK